MLETPAACPLMTLAMMAVATAAMMGVFLEVGSGEPEGKGRSTVLVSMITEDLQKSNHPLFSSSILFVSRRSK